MAKKNNKIRLRAGASIGELAAEDDCRFLSDCFVSHPAAEALKDPESTQCIALGRTGSGKSALLLQFEETLEQTSRIDPKDVAFTYVGNSPIISQVSGLGVDMHTLYEYLWTHIIVLHIIKKHLGAESPDRLRRLLQRIENAVKQDPKRKIALDYLEKHAGDFWITVEQVATEVANTLTDTLAAEAGVDAKVFKAQIEGGEEWSESSRRTYKHRAQSVVSNLQMRELKETINALSECLDNSKTYYVLIDDLDRDWAGSDATHYALIRALIESLKTFRRIPNLKIVTAMREDLFEATLRHNSDKHFQAEKLEGIVRRLRWSDDLLIELVNRRLTQMFKRTYTKQQVKLDSIFPKKIAQQPLDEYIVEQTLRRPRDVIALVNKVLVMNEGQELPLTSRNVTQSEASYSSDRMRALVDEWRSCHPLVKYYVQLLAGLGVPARVSDLDGNRLLDVIVESEILERPVVDNVERAAKLVYKRHKDVSLEKLSRQVIVELYKIGAVGLKLGSAQTDMFCYEQRSTVEMGEVTRDTRFVIHPMLRAALGVHAQPKCKVAA